MEYDNRYEFVNTYDRFYYDICKQDHTDKNTIIYYLDNQVVLAVWHSSIDAAVAFIEYDATITTKLKSIDV